MFTFRTSPVRTKEEAQLGSTFDFNSYAVTPTEGSTRTQGESHRKVYDAKTSQLESQRKTDQTPKQLFPTIFDLLLMKVPSQSESSPITPSTQLQSSTTPALPQAEAEESQHRVFKPTIEALSISEASTSSSEAGATTPPAHSTESLESKLSALTPTSAAKVAFGEIEEWIRSEHRDRHCNETGKVAAAAISHKLQREHRLDKLSPRVRDMVCKALSGLDDVPAYKPVSTKDADNGFVMVKPQTDKHTLAEANPTKVQEQVSNLSPKFPHVQVEQTSDLDKGDQTMPQAKAAKLPSTQAITPSKPNLANGPTSLPAMSQPPLSSITFSNVKPPLSVEAWVHQQYLAHGFYPTGEFKGFSWLKMHLQSLDKIEDVEISRIVNVLRQAGHQYSFDLRRDKKKVIKSTQSIHSTPAQSTSRPVKTNNDFHNNPTGSLATSTWAPHESTKDSSTAAPMNTSIPMDAATTTISQIDMNSLPKDDLLSRKLNQLHVSSGTKDGDEGRSNEDSVVDNSLASRNAFILSEDNLMSSLLSDESNDNKVVDEVGAPILSGTVLLADKEDKYPQYGLMGSYERERLFLNTHVPFSAFICGVQGSGKSHTTATILENALIPSKQLGRLESPLSALVFSYGRFGGNGSGFSISEAAFLAAPHPKFPDHPHVKKIHVLVSPSNFINIARLYLRVPNVTVTKFKLKPRNLNVDIIKTLMNVSESDDIPLYMATVTQLLRQMATESASFNYFDFKARLRKCKFQPAQSIMLQMRLDLLESFLDLDDSCPEPQFKEGEVTIMDLSCPFVDASTACTLFDIALQRYLESTAAGKMIVLDEAHRYMLPNPGAKALNETILAAIREQRHKGVRVIISTQEPTLRTDLIALCSITVIHRFTSPEWFAAIKRHIPIPGEPHMVMQSIESLKTGTALVYSPNAALGRDEDGKLVKGTGKLMKVNVRKRVTSDGGQSVLAS